MTTYQNPPALDMNIDISSPLLSEDKTNYLNTERMELICPNCNASIGFVNYLIHDQRRDKCTKCKEFYKYNFNFINQLTPQQ